MDRNDRLQWLQIYEGAEEGDEILTSRPSDPLLAAAVAIVEEYGWWSDPVLGPESVLEMAELAYAAIAPTVLEPSVIDQILDHLNMIEDEGPWGEGWKSDGLQGLIDLLEARRGPR